MASKVLSKLAHYRDRLEQAVACIVDLRELILEHETQELRRFHANPLNRFGLKCFSQADEDGITLEILRRIGCVSNGTFAEFGVGNGLENNTLILKAIGWRGFWAGGENLAFDIGQPSSAFSYFKEWITLENIESIAIEGKKNLQCQEMDVISLDLDGNDYYFAERLLSRGFLPKLFIIEYNAKFPPPVRWKIDYDAGHVWKYDDYFGASLASLNDLFQLFEYRLVSCNSQTGSNAFFIRRDFLSAFDDVPREIEKLYVPPRYYLHERYGHRGSNKTVGKLFG